MTKKQFDDFCKLRDNFKNQIEEWNKEYNKILKRKIEEVEAYEILNSFIYNEKLDEITEKNNIKYIWVQDNPGYNEMLQGRYAVGSSGKTGQNFLLNMNLAEDFDKQVIVLNKSPIHTKITSNLTKLKNKDIQNMTQEYMADLIYKFHKVFKCDLWILGISSLNSIFKVFTENIQSLYTNNSLNRKLYLYYHFSQGQFKKAYNQKEKEAETKDVEKILEDIGIANKNKYFDF